MCWWFLSLLVVTVTGMEECRKSQHEGMQEEFTECSMKYSHVYHDTRGKLAKPGDFQAATCLLLSQTIDSCGKVWEQCHDEEDIRKMKDMHITGLVYQYSNKDSEDVGINVNQCRVVREYRESGRQEKEEYGEDEMCTTTQSIKVQNKFQTCSHSTSVQLQKTIMDVTDPTIVTESICKALATIASVCVKILKECFSSEDAERMRNHHLGEMKRYLLQIVEYNVNNRSLSNCQVMKTIGMPSDEDESYENYDVTNDINGNQPVNVTTHENDQQEKLEVRKPSHMGDRKGILETIEVNNKVLIQEQEQRSSSTQTVIQDKYKTNKESSANKSKDVKEKVEQQKVIGEIRNSAVVSALARGIISVCFLLSVSLQSRL